MVEIDLVDGMIEKIRFHLEALGLITGVMAEYADEFNHIQRDICWQLTPKGRKYIANMHTFKKAIENK